MRTIGAVVLVLLVGMSTLSLGVATAAGQQAEGYAGTHVSFETASNSIVDYTVDDETMLQSVTVQSQSNTEVQDGVSTGIRLSAVTQLSGSALTLDSQTDVSATVTTESGATMHAHDNSRGILVVQSGGESQYVTVNLSSSSQAESETDERVVITAEDGTTGTFLVAGEGEVTVNDQGNVSANLGSNGTLVFRSYPEGRNNDDRQEEQFISDGTAAAEVYVMQTGEQGSELAADVVQYSADTTVEVTQKSEGTVKMTAERSQEQGKIIITSVSEQAISSTDDLQVTVDGEAAARASSYSELEGTTDNGDSSKYLVRQQSNADASANVLIGVNHFSEREITMSSGSDDSSTESGSDSDSNTEDGGDGTDEEVEDSTEGDSDTTSGEGNNGEGGETTSTSVPGFDSVGALVAVIAVALYAYRRP